MCCRVFKFIRKSDVSFIYLNGDSSCSPDSILRLYVDWYNSEFAPLEDLPCVCFDDFLFFESFCPIDFYDESVKITRFK